MNQMRRGYWLTKEYTDGDPAVGVPSGWFESLAEPGDCAYCSECGEHALLNDTGKYELSNYCPNCGAKMTEDHHEQKE